MAKLGCYKLILCCCLVHLIEVDISKIGWLIGYLGRLIERYLAELHNQNELHLSHSRNICPFYSHLWNLTCLKILLNCTTKAKDNFNVTVNQFRLVLLFNYHTIIIYNPSNLCTQQHTQNRQWKWTVSIAMAAHLSLTAPYFSKD